MSDGKQTERGQANRKVQQTEKDRKVRQKGVRQKGD
jgi:hypothetical protein